MERFQEPAVVAALHEYKSIVSKHNLTAATYFVNYANNRSPRSQSVKQNTAQSDHVSKEPDSAQDEKDGAERLKWCIRVLLYSSQVPKELSNPQDIITKWDMLASKHGLDGAAIRGSPDERAARWDSIVRGLRSGLQEAGDDAAELDIPGDFSILLKHADTLEGHLWQKAKQEERGCVWFQGFNGYEDAKASVRYRESLRGSPARAWGSGDEPEYDVFQDVVAGFETGYMPEGGCFMIYGRRTGDEERKWYYYLNMGQYGTESFDSLVDFLKWYQDYNIADERDMADECRGVFVDRRTVWG